MAVFEHLEKLKEGVEAWNKWRQDRTPPPNLSGADLKGRNLRGIHFDLVALAGADLRGANLDFASLSLANLISAKLDGARLAGANFRRANCEGASFANAKFSDTNLDGAILKSANCFSAFLHGTTFSRTDLDGTDFTNALMAQCIFADADLSTAHGLETVRYHLPSTIGVDTIYRSRGKIPLAFLQAAGISKEFLQRVQPLVAGGFHPCFISYSSKDRTFAKLLYDRLWEGGVQCWLFEEDAKGGEPVWAEIDRAINKHQKTLLVCSENSLQSQPVIREIERALQREDREAKSILFPITIDDYLFERWAHPRKADVVNKVALKFLEWQNPMLFERALQQLLSDLKATDSTAQGS